MNIALTCRNLSKTFVTNQDEALLALDRVNLEVQAHRFTAVVGPSGCGKSTLLHIIAGLDSDFEGQFISSIKGNRIAYIFQQPRLLPWLSAERNVAFILEALGQSRPEALTAARHYLHLVGLSGFEQCFPSQLSGGMQQRIALARALAVEPELMLMDEPFASLDELTARRMRDELLRLFQGMARTVLFVTHNVTEAAFLADRVIVISKRPGRILAEIPINLPRPRDYDGAAVAALAHNIFEKLQLD